MGGTCPLTAKRPHRSQAWTLGSWRVCCESLLASEGLGLGEPSSSPSVSQAQPRSLLLPPPLSQGSPSPVAKPLPSGRTLTLKSRWLAPDKGGNPAATETAAQAGLGSLSTALDWGGFQESFWTHVPRASCLFPWRRALSGPALSRGGGWGEFIPNPLPQFVRTEPRVASRGARN